MGESRITEEDVKKVIDYYRKLDVQKFKLRINAIGRLLAEKVPSIVSVFGLGYPFYGEYDVSERIKNTVRKYGLHHPQTRSILPDVDLLVVYDTDEHPNILDDSFERKTMDDFIRAISKDSLRWKEAQEELISKHGIASRDSDVFDEFNSGRLHIDFVPVPLELWKDIPYLFHPRDLEKLKKLRRDLLFTGEHIHTKKPYSYDNLQNIRDEYLKNYLLYHVHEHVGTPEEIINSILRSHEHWPLMKKFPEIHSYQFSKWLDVLKQLDKEGMIENASGKIMITEKGKKHFDAIMKIRERKRKRWGLK